jgi:acetyl-CoA carboxylase biotin carboxylase subunit
MSACEITGAEAIHPGYGFLSENANFVQIVEDHGIKFIGPSAEHIRMMGDKITAKDTMQKLGVPCVPGSDGGVPIWKPPRPSRRHRLSGHHQGDRRRRRARHEARPVGEAELETPFAPRGPRPRPPSAMTRSISRNTSARRAISRCRSSATARAARCIWASATVRCSGATRRCWKKRPAPPSTPRARADRRDLRQGDGRDLGYEGAGTIEFLYEDGEFYFIEMNTRLQVEHPVTEAIFGVDLVREQIRVAAGLPMSFTQDDLR